MSDGSPRPQESSFVSSLSAVQMARSGDLLPLEGVSSEDRNKLFMQLDRMCDQLKEPLEDLCGETQQETEILYGIFVKTLVSILDRDIKEIEEFRGSTRKFLNALSRRFPTAMVELSEEEYQDYYNEKRRQYGLTEDQTVIDLMRALLESMVDKIFMIFQAFPKVVPGIVGALHFCFAYNNKAGAMDDIQALDEPAIMAFSFGTGKKIGPGLEHESLTGPGVEQPGQMNCGLAKVVKDLLAVRKMPVFAQWEIADALMYGEDGAPPDKAAGYYEYDTEKYPYRETWDGHDIFKAVALWPEICKEQGMTLKQMGESSSIKQYYLSTQGVVNFFQSSWRLCPEVKPKSLIIVAHKDHLARCVATFRAQSQVGRVMSCPTSLYPDWEDVRCTRITGYDPLSTQEWTMSRSNFLEKEVPWRFAMAISLLEQSKYYNHENKYFADLPTDLTTFADLPAELTA